MSFCLFSKAHVLEFIDLFEASDGLWIFLFFSVKTLSYGLFLHLQILLRELLSS